MWGVRCLIVRQGHLSSLYSIVCDVHCAPHYNLLSPVLLLLLLLLIIIIITIIIIIIIIKLGLEVNINKTKYMVTDRYSLYNGNGQLTTNEGNLKKKWQSSNT